MKKYSKQRELILTSLQNRCDHPTAQMLYMELKEQMPSIGIATVYRNLLDLSKQKQINRIIIKDGPDRFDGNLVKHIHFACDKCSTVQDIFLSQTELEEMDQQMELFAKSIGAQKQDTQILITGLCKDCRQKSI